MPLARYSIYAQGPDLYLAPTWASGEVWLATLRHIAFEGRCWVLGNCTAMRGRDVPPDFPDRDRLFPDLDTWFNGGDSAIVSPSGEMVAGPLHESSGILYADCDPKAARNARRTLDVAGHYSRSDVFNLEVDTAERPPVRLQPFAFRERSKLT